MVAEYTPHVGELAHTEDALVGIWPITHQVTQAPGGVDLARFRQHSLQGGQVGVDIGDDQNSHEQDDSIENSSREAFGLSRFSTT
jgi:hypothetical protein